MSAIEMQLEWVAPGDLVPNPRNPRRMGREGMVKLERSIREMGFTTPALVQRSSRMLIAGHQRTKAAIAVGVDRIPVLLVDVDDATAERIMLADNRLGEEAEWDSDRLAELFRDVGLETAELTGFTEAEFAAVLEDWQSDLDARSHRRAVEVDWDALGRFYHVAALEQLGGTPAGMGVALEFMTLAAGQQVPVIDGPVLLLAGNRLGIEEHGGEWVLQGQEVVTLAAALRDGHPIIVEAPAFPVVPGILKAIGRTPEMAVRNNAYAAKETQKFARALDLGVLFVLPREAEHAAAYLKVAKPKPPDLVGVVAGDDPQAAYDAVTAVLAADLGVPVHLCGAADPAVAAAGIRAGASSIDTPVAAASGFDQVVIPVRRLEGGFGVKRLRFEELASADLAPTGRLKEGLARANWLTTALMFEATLALEVGAVKEAER